MSEERDRKWLTKMIQDSAYYEEYKDDLFDKNGNLNIVFQKLHNAYISIHQITNKIRPQFIGIWRGRKGIFQEDNNLVLYDFACKLCNALENQEKFEEICFAEVNTETYIYFIFVDFKRNNIIAAHRTSYDDLGGKSGNNMQTI